MNTISRQKTQLGVGYIRESSDEQDKGFSPDNQKRTIQDYADKHSIRIVGWYKDLISGTQSLNRDDFQRMIADSEKNKFEVILVFHSSRFARNITEAKDYKNRLRQKLDIDIISVTQNFGDWKQPSGYLNETINEVFDEYYSKQLSFWVRSSLEEKRKQGKQNGNPPLGYYKRKIGFDKEKDIPIYAKEWLIHPTESKIVKKIFASYATGTNSLAKIAVELNKLNLRTKLGYAFTYSSIKDILDNKVYLGFVFSKRKNYPELKGIHKPIIGKKLFEKVQEAFTARRNTKGRPVAQHRFYLLQDVAFCYHCKRHLKGKEDSPYAKMLPKMFCQTFSNGGGKEYLTYGCKFRKETGTCNQPFVRVEVIDGQVLKFMEGFNIPSEIIDKTLAKLKRLFTEAAQSPKDIGIVEKLKARRKKLNFIFANTDNYNEEQYLTLNKEIDEQLKKYDQLGIVKSNSKMKAVEYIRQTEKFLREYKQFWSILEDKEKRAWILMTIKRVWIKDDKVVAIEPKDDFKPLFTSHRKVLVQPPSGTPTKDISEGWCFLLE